jgi:2-polyprenyl-3-methyl-5-hydroxy-6-metoxy-1,4-benzoquinol methylase
MAAGVAHCVKGIYGTLRQGLRNEYRSRMSTDLEWEQWGRQDPYYGVITNDKFRTAKLDEAARVEFFDSGKWHVKGVLNSCRHYIDPTFAPKRVLDFGCGVGRTLIPFAQVAEQVVGVDVSASMLTEARRNCDERGLTNVSLVGSDDSLSEVKGVFDLVHSIIVLQHIEVARGRRIIQRLVDCVAPGGVGALQLTYAKAYHPDTFGQPPAPPPSASVDAPAVSSTGLLNRIRRRGTQAAASVAPALHRAPDPEMQMNPYNLSEVAFILQTAGIAKVHSEFTDHGGELGVFMYFRRPSSS